MAITVVKTDKGLLKFETFDIDVAEEDSKFFKTKDKISVVTSSIVDDNLNPLSDMVKYEMSGTEEDFHMKLRVAAHAELKYMRSLSTNPEWNPGYKKKKKKNEDI